MDSKAGIWDGPGSPLTHLLPPLFELVIIILSPFRLRLHHHHHHRHLGRQAVGQKGVLGAGKVLVFILQKIPPVLGWLLILLHYDNHGRHVWGAFGDNGLA